MTKHKPVYNLQVRYGKAGKQLQVLKLSAPFTLWFDSDGYFVATPFQQWLATEIPIVGEADPLKADKGAAKKEQDQATNPQPTKGSEDLIKAPIDGASSSGARSRKTKKPT